ncbi:hypothetical protein JHW43_005548 [Diplocarpon mali]|nr:hypothetical protein JHW43_005548 [Diplocarpon mali]
MRILRVRPSLSPAYSEPRRARRSDETRSRHGIPARVISTLGKGGGGDADVPTCRRADVEHVPEGGEPGGTGRNRSERIARLGSAGSDTPTAGGEGRARGWLARHLLLTCSGVGRRAAGRCSAQGPAGNRHQGGDVRVSEGVVATVLLSRSSPAPLPLLSRSGSRSARPLCRADETRGGPDGRHTPRSRRGSGSGLDSPDAGGFRRETAGRGSADQKSGRGGRWGEMGGGRGVMKEG